MQLIGFAYRSCAV